MTAASGKPQSVEVKLGRALNPLSEESIHRSCAVWVFAHEPIYPELRWLLHVPNGGKRSRGEAGKMKAMGVRRGVPDWILPFASSRTHYAGLAIEIKSAKGSTTHDQDQFLAAAQLQGWLAVVARSVEEFESAVLQWLGISAISPGK